MDESHAVAELASHQGPHACGFVPVAAAFSRTHLFALVERFFNEIKQCRRVATRDDQARGQLPGDRGACINKTAAAR
jgi:hypothetical protein